MSFKYTNDRSQESPQSSPNVFLAIFLVSGVLRVNAAADWRPAGVL